MRAFLKLNGVDFGGYIAADGIAYGEEARRSTSVDTADGVRRAAAIYKPTLAVTFRAPLRGSVVDRLVTICKPHIVSASFIYEGQATTRTMMVTGLTYTTSQVIGQDTLYSGVTLNLVER